MAWFKDETEPGNADTFYNERTKTFQRKQDIAERLVEGGQCTNYDEAYALLNGARPGDMIMTRGGVVRK